MEYARKTSKRAVEKTKEMTRQMFNEILKQEDCTPTTWRRIGINVIHKKADVGRGRKLHARVGSGDHSRRWTTWRD